MIYLKAYQPLRSDNDLYLFFAIFHGLSDADCKKVLKNLKSAVGAKQPYILFGDAVAAETHIDPVIAAFDMQMLIGTMGHERTLNEWNRLLTDGGFKIIEIMDVRTFAKFIIAKPCQ